MEPLQSAGVLLFLPNAAEHAHYQRTTITAMPDFSFLPARKRDGMLIAGHYSAQVFLGRDLEGRQHRPRKMVCPEGCLEVSHRSAIKFSGSKAAALQAAQRWADHMRAATSTGDTFTDVAARMLASGRLATSTRKEYTSRLKPGGRITPVFGSVKVSDITTRDIAEWRDYWDRKQRAGQIAASTINQDWAIIRAVMRTAHEGGLIMVNPTTGIRRVPQSEPAIAAPKWEDVQAILDHLRGTGLPGDLVIAAMVSTAVLTGMRLGELVVLRWEYVDFSAMPVDQRRGVEDWPRIRVRWSFDSDLGRKPPKSRRGVRDIVMSDQLVALLAAWRDTQPLTPWVFHSTSDAASHIFHDRPTKRIRRIVEQHEGGASPCDVCGRKDLRVWMHGLRHLTGATAADAGVPVTAIAEMLGDDPQTVARNYIRTDAGGVAAAMAVSDAARQLTVG